jgi:hypothetical protein
MYVVPGSVLLYMIHDTWIYLHAILVGSAVYTVRNMYAGAVHAGWRRMIIDHTLGFEIQSIIVHILAGPQDKNPRDSYPISQ